MQRQTASFRLLFSLGLLLLGSALAQPGLAQSQPKTNSQPPAATPAAEKRQLFTVNIVHVNPALREDWVAAQKELLAIEQKGGGKWRQVWTPFSSGNTLEFHVIRPLENYAQFDQPARLPDGVTQESMQALGAKLNRATDSRETLIVQSRPDLSFGDASGKPPKLASLVLVRVAPGRNLEYENFVKTEVLPVVKRSGVAAYQMSKIVQGGDPMQYVISVPYDSFAELDKGSPLVRVLGEAGYNKLIQKLAGVVTHVESYIIRHNPELSFTAPAAPAKAENKQ